MRNSRLFEGRDKLIPVERPEETKLSGPNMVILMLGVAALFGGVMNGWSQAPPQLPDGAGKDTVQKACGSCHALTTVT